MWVFESHQYVRSGQKQYIKADSDIEVDSEIDYFKRCKKDFEK